MAKVKFKALTDAAYKAIQAADIDDNKLYFVTDKGALYKGATLIADVTANSAGAFMYKGTIGNTGATVTTLPAVHEQGWIYIVLTAEGTYAGKSCQIGDMIVCKASGSVAADTDWDIIPLNFSVVNNAPTLAWGTTSTVATIDGKTISVKMPNNPNTVANHYAPAEDTAAQKTASGATGTAGATVQVVTGIKMDAKGHVTGIVSGAATDTNTDTKVTSVANHYAPAEDTSSKLQAEKSSPATNITSVETAVVTGIKRDAKGHAVGVYTATLKATDTKVTSVANHYEPIEDSQKTASGATGTAGATVQVVTGIKMDAKGHVTGIVSGAATDTKPTQTNHYTPDTEDTNKKQTASGATVPSVGTTQQVIKAIKLDSKGHVVGIESAAVKDTDTMGDLVVADDPTEVVDASDDIANGKVNINFLPGDGSVHAHEIEGVNGCEVTYDAANSTILVECTCCEWE